MDQDVIDPLKYTGRVIEALGVERYKEYCAALETLKINQDREIYELRMHQCSERMQLLASFGADGPALSGFWHAQMSRFTRRFQARCKGRNVSTVHL